MAETQRSAAPLTAAPAAPGHPGRSSAHPAAGGLPQSRRGGRGCSSGLGRLHPGQVHEEVPELRHVHVVSAGGVPALSALDEIPEPHRVKEPHGAFGAELLPWFLRLCQPPVRVSVTVKAFASKWTGPFALLKVFTSFFPEKQKRIMSKPGCRQTTPRHLCRSRVSLPSEVTGRLRDAGSRSPRWTVVHHGAESHAHGEPQWPPGQQA